MTLQTLGLPAPAWLDAGCAAAATSSHQPEDLSIPAMTIEPLLSTRTTSICLRRMAVTSSTVPART